jgi:hypothetical protein
MKKNKKKEERELDIKKSLKIIDIKKILAYSAIKINANPTLPYSILNPETNSDSPSAKSKGVRLVSATQEINQIPTKGKKINNFIQNRFNEKFKKNLKDPPRIR